MPKRIRTNPIYLAPNILGYYDVNGSPVARNEVSGELLNPNSIDHKIIIYSRQVHGWFLEPATQLLNSSNSNFIVLMICFSYLEGVEQYRIGQSSNGNSRLFFRNSIYRLFPSQNFTEHELNDLYREARCGLFHNGMVQGKIILNDSFTPAISFPNQNDIHINPNLLLTSIIADFNSYLNDLRTDDFLRRNFNLMFTNL
jgi:hypothetical protein